MSVTRRTFCEAVLSSAAAVGTTSLLGGGCGNQVALPGKVAGALDDVAASPTYGQVTVPLTTELTVLGAAVVVEVTQPRDPSTSFMVPTTGILLVHYAAQGEPDEFVAVGALCTHQQCPLGYNPQDLLIECPCHGSRFLAGPDPNLPGSKAGDVAHLPAMQPLQTWQAQVDATRTHVAINLMGSCNATEVVQGGQVTLPLSGVAQASSQVFKPCGLADRLLVVRPDASTVHVLSSVCTHQQCDVAYDAATKDLLCPCHQSRYDAATGAVLAGPAPSPLKVYRSAVSADGSTVTVTVT